MKSGPDFNTLAIKLRRLPHPGQYPTKILCIDPGETTGWAQFHCWRERVDLHDSGQLMTPYLKLGVDGIVHLLNETNPNVLVVEDYRIYGWKTQDHSWSKLHTPKYIGAIYAVAYLRSIPVVFQMAQFAKEFCTDDKLKRWGFYEKGQRHARDAIRHGCAYILFHK